MTLSQEMEDNTVYTVEKKQAQENPNRFNSIWVSLSYFKVGFFTYGQEKRIWTKSLLHFCLSSSFFSPSSFFPYLSWIGTSWVVG